ncbi:MAG: M20 family metallo-hydrolase [Bryobacterales bacterium]|nr:M20 family metallo-hydrolase [Bryobacterales bacterium]MBV9401326.1 M20 family metallo-hydrolase [Bryobacterales bacterium]
MKLHIDKDRLARELDQLASISDAPAPVVTRVVFTEADLRARAFLKGLCSEAGLQIREDAVGNTFVRWVGIEPKLPAVGTGSHIDAIPNAGRFDGTVGVLGGLEAIRALARAGFQPRRSIELVIFTAEEPTRFGVGCLGSRLLSGALDASAGGRLKDREGKTLDDVRLAANFSGSLDHIRLPDKYYHAFVELHIEQGPILEQEHIDLGIVTAIAAPAGMRFWIEGEGGHAGAVPMADRQDAFLAAAEIALCIESAAKASGGSDTVATTGVCDVFPGAMNSIPSQVRMEADVRDIDLARRDRVLDKIMAAAEQVAARRRVSVTTEVLNADPPGRCDPMVITALTCACEAHRASSKRMISRAYHDSLFMSLIAPAAMLFIPCRGGVSHRPDEYASPEAIARGTLVLAEALASLSG